MLSPKPNPKPNPNANPNPNRYRRCTVPRSRVNNQKYSIPYLCNRQNGLILYYDCYMAVQVLAVPVQEINDNYIILYYIQYYFLSTTHLVDCDTHSFYTYSAITCAVRLHRYIQVQVQAIALQ